MNLPFLLCFTLYLRAIFQVQAPGGLYLEEVFNGRFFALPVWGAYIWRGLYMERLIFAILRYVTSHVGLVFSQEITAIVLEVKKSCHCLIFSLIGHYLIT